jgi:hypothetical protein
MRRRRLEQTSQVPQTVESQLASRVLGDVRDRFPLGRKLHRVNPALTICSGSTPAAPFEHLTEQLSPSRYYSMGRFTG